MNAVHFPSWLLDFRAKHQADFLLQGIPTKHNERWKYANLTLLSKKNFPVADYPEEKKAQAIIQQHRLKNTESILFVFINGHFISSYSEINNLPQGVIACSLNEALMNHAELVQQHGLLPIDGKKYPFASLNAATFADGFFFYLPDECDITIPIHLLFIAHHEQEFISHPRHLFVLGKYSCAQLLEEYVGMDSHYFMNTVSTIILNEGVKLTHCKIQKESKEAIHLAQWFIHQGKNSESNFVQISSGALFARDEIIIRLKEEGASCRTSGFYKTQTEDQYVDYHIDVTHEAPLTNSEMLYKGILDKKSRAVFNGKLYVEKNAQKISGYQANHHLLLSNEAEAYSKPELEIYADDVKCKHGATTGELNQEALFYLRTRGIDEKNAIHILLQGFAEEVTKRILNATIKSHVEETLSC